jgi:hypothetical protein
MVIGRPLDNTRREDRAHSQKSLSKHGRSRAFNRSNEGRIFHDVPVQAADSKLVTLIAMDYSPTKRASCHLAV